MSERANRFQLSTIYCRSLGSRSTARSKAKEQKSDDQQEEVFSLPRYGALLARRRAQIPSPSEGESTTQIPQPRKHPHQIYFQIHPHGVLHRLANLTSVTPETENKRLNELSPDHCKALENVGLPPKSYKYPTLREQIL